MSPKKFDPQVWGRQLDAGAQTDPALRLAAQLEQNRPAARPLDPHFREKLRRNLLGRADAAPAQRLGQWAVSFAAFLLLATAVAFFWTSQAANQPVLPGAADEAESVDLTLLDEQAEAMQLELALMEETVSAERWELRRIVQSVNGDELIIRATFAYTATSRPASAHFALLPANQPDAADSLTLHSTAVSETTDEVTMEFAIDPLVVWRQFGSFDLVLARVTEWELDNEWVVETQLFVDRPLTLRTEWMDRLWLNSVTPEPGTPLDQTAFTVELGYRLLSAPTADIRLLIAHPAWESANLGAGGRLPVNGAGDPASVTRGEGTLTFTFATEDAAYLRQVIGAEATLAAHMLVPGADGVMQALAQKTFTDYAWPVADIVERPSDQLWFVSISPEPGATVEEGDLLTAVIGYELHSADTGWIHLALTHAEWEGVNPPSAPFGWQSVAAGTGEISVQLTVDDLAVLQAHAGQYVRLEAQLGAADEQNQRQLLVTTALEDAPWRLGQTMVGVPRIPPQAVITPDESVANPVTRLAVLDVQASADSATGLTPILFTAQLAYGLAARQAEEAAVMIWAIPEDGGVSQVVVAEMIQVGAGTMEVTFSFNPQRDLRENLRQPRRYLLMFSLNVIDGAGNPPLTNYTFPETWEFGP
jgi:hypothetical protein